MKLRILEPLRVRDFRLLWSGQAVSYVGNGVMMVAMAFETLAVSPKATSLSLVLMARAIPLLALSLVGGALTDRLPRRGILMASDAGRGVATAVTAVLIAVHAIRLWHLIVLSAVFGAAEAFFFPAFTAIVPEILSGDLLVQANSVESSIRPLTVRMAGPALGGIVVAAFGAASAFALDATTFVVSVVFVLRIRTRPGHAGGERPGLLTDIREGLRYARSQAWFSGTLLMAAVAVLFFAGPVDVLMPIYAKTHLHVRAAEGARAYGFLVGAMGLGGILGALTASQTGIGVRRVRNMFLVWGVAVVPFALLPLTATPWVAMTMMGLVGFGFEIGSILWMTLLQDLVPARLMGRARSLDYMVSFGLLPVSYALAGPAAAGIGILPSIAWGGALAAAFTFAFMLYPGVLRPDSSSWEPAEGSKAWERRRAATPA